MLRRAARTRASAVVAIAMTVALMFTSVPAVASTASVPRTRPVPDVTRAAPHRVAPTGVRTLDADDSFSGAVSIPASPVSGTLNASTDVDDVYAVALGDGDTLTASITGPAGTYFDLFLYEPGSVGAPGDDFVAYSNADPENVTYPIVLDFRVDAAGGHLPGTYYLDAWASSGSGAYTITWRIIPADNNNDIPGEPIPASPFTRWNTSAIQYDYGHKDDIDYGTFVDTFDVYAIDLAEGDQLTAKLTASNSDLDMEMLLYPQHATHVDTDGEVSYSDAWVSATDFGTAGLPESLSFVVPPGGAGTYYLDAEAWGGSGDYTMTWSVDQSNLVRMQGANRYSTGLSIVRGTTLGSQYAVIASGANYPDALSAAGIAGAYGAPLLLTNPTTLRDDLKVQLVELGVTDVIIVGGTKAVSSTVFEDLVAMDLAVERISGSDRYATSAACAERVAQETGMVAGAFLVRGDSFSDALSVAPFAYTQAMPVLLTKPAALPGSIQSFIDTYDVPSVYIAGGTSAVSASVAGKVDALNEGSTVVTRIQGSDRYRTARAVADYGVGEGWGAYGFVGVATGTNFPDALAGGVACGKMNGVLLLTKPTVLSSACSAAISANVATIDRVAVFGGTGAVSSGVYNSIKALLP